MGDEPFWVVLEQLGHRRTAGKVSQVEMFGGVMGRIDIPGPDGTFTTHFFGAGSVYGMTPVSEEMARAVAARNQPEPVHRYELPAPAAAPARVVDHDDDDPDDDREALFGRRYDDE